MTRSVYICPAWLLASVLLVAACGADKGALPGTRPPAFATDFVPPPPLPEPPAPEPGKVGLLYLQQVYSRLGAPWQTFLEDCRLRLPPEHPLNQPSLAVRVRIAVDRQGVVRSATLEQASGQGDFDEAAMEIVRDASPLPEPPYHLISDDDLVHLSWLFARDLRQAGVATAALHVIEWPAPRAVPKLLGVGDVTGAAERLLQAQQAGGDAAALRDLGREIARAAIREALRGQEPAAQRLAARVAAEARLLGAAPELRAIIDGSVDATVRGEAIAAVGAIGDEGAAQILVSVLENAKGSGIGGRADASVAAAQALAAIGRRPIAESTILGWLAAGDEESLWAALVVLSDFGVPGAGATLAGLLADPARPRQVRVAACTALGASAEPASAAVVMRTLQKHLSEPDAAVRAACARAVARAARAGVRHRSAYWALVEAMKKDRDERVRAAAVLGAAHLEPERFGQEIYLLRGEQSALVLAAVAEALAVVPGEPSVARLISLSAHRDEAVRGPAAASLAAHGSEPARRALATLVDDPDVAVRALAAGALPDGPVLERMLADEAPEVRAAAFAARVRARGPAATLEALARGIVETRPGSLERVAWVAAWLRP